jgi:hypothetical protein
MNLESNLSEAGAINTVPLASDGDLYQHIHVDFVPTDWYIIYMLKIAYLIHKGRLTLENTRMFQKELIILWLAQTILLRSLKYCKGIYYTLIDTLQPQFTPT